MIEEIDSFISNLGRASAILVLADKRRNKAEQLKSVTERRCGNCYHWMKNSCKPEKELKQFKSMNSYACKDFALSDCGSLIPKFTQELAEIDQEIKIATTGDQ